MLLILLQPKRTEFLFHPIKNPLAMPMDFFVSFNHLILTITPFYETN